MFGPRSHLDRREFLAAGGVGLVPWSTVSATVAPAPSVAWTFEVPDGNLARTPLATQTGVYVTSKNALHALSARGKSRWTHVFDAGWPDVRPASADDETLYVRVGSEAIYAVEREDGRIRWRRGGDERRWRSAVVIDRTVFVLGDRLAALSTTDGRTRWQFDTRGEGFWRPTVGAGVVVAGTVGGTVHAVDATTGAERWTFVRPYDRDDPEGFYPVEIVEPESSPDALVLVWDPLEGRLFAVDVADGSVRWQFESGREEFAFPGVVTGVLSSWSGSVRSRRSAWPTERPAGGSRPTDR